MAELVVWSDDDDRPARGQDVAVRFKVPFSGPPQLRWEEAVLERDLIGYSWITLSPAQGRHLR